METATTNGKTATQVLAGGNGSASAPALTKAAGLSRPRNFVEALAAQVGMDPKKYYETVKNTVFKGASDAELNTLLMVAHEYDLNPLLKQIYAFPSQKGIQPMVPIDGWVAIANRNPVYAGYEVVYPDKEEWTSIAGKPCPEWIEVTIFRKDQERSYPHREYIDECYRDTGPWKSHPKRMLKHKAYIQSCRYALGVSGIYDDDEAGMIMDMEQGPGGDWSTYAKGAEPAGPSEDELWDKVYDLMDDRDPVAEMQLREFVKLSAAQNRVEIPEFLAAIIQDGDSFALAFNTWKGSKSDGSGPESQAEGDDKPPIRRRGQHQEHPELHQWKTCGITYEQVQYLGQAMAANEDARAVVQDALDATGYGDHEEALEFLRAEEAVPLVEQVKEILSKAGPVAATVECPRNGSQVNPDEECADCDSRPGCPAHDE